MLRAMLRVAAIFTLLATTAWANPVPTPKEAAAAPEAPVVSEQAVTVSLRPSARQMTIPEARWGEDKARWSLAILSSLRSHAHGLPDIVPRDIAEYCPAYPTASREDREAFWVGLVSSLAWHESTHRPTAVGGGGRWYGLTQIYPPTAKLYRCKARTGAELKDPEDNLSCAMRIMAVTVPRDGVISRSMRGVAADWGPFHSSRKRNDIKAWVKEQDYCKGLSRSLRPVARPVDLLPETDPPTVMAAGHRAPIDPIIASRSEN